MKLGLTGRRHDVEGLYQQLTGWDEFPQRTEHPASPHRELSDIWVRYNDFKNFAGGLESFNGPHLSVWYPIAEHMPEAKRIAQEVAGSGELGAVLITRIPAGKQCYPHIDSGWHARYYDKIAVQIRGHEKQSFHVEDQTLVTRTGDEFVFDNSRVHWVRNESDEDRITMIICVRNR